MDIEKRTRMAAESILENEAIREGLDDNGASALLDWGVSCAVRIMHDMDLLEDDEEAQEAAYPRMRALRQMLESVKNVVQPQTTRAEGVSFLAELLEKAALVYGEKETLPERIYWNVFTALKVDDTGQNILTLRGLVEKNIPLKEQ